MSNKKYRKFVSIVRKRSGKPVRPFTKLQVKALKEGIKQAGGTFTDIRHKIALTTTMTALPGVSGSSFFKLASGDSEDTREGDSISATSLTIRGTLSSADLRDSTVRLMLVQYVNNSGANISEVLDDHAPPLGDYTDANSVVNSFRKLHPEVKYRVLAQKIVTLKGGNNATNNFTVRNFTISHKFSKAQASMNYDADTAVGPKTNPVWLYACYARQTATQTAPFLEYQVRGKFIR
jgi:hypothetical protein